MNLEEWLETVPIEIKQDTLWKMKVYRLALFAADLGWKDINRIRRDERIKGIADQVYRALGSISANVAEGYSRGSGKDRARFYEYALGSARESRDWYYKCRNVLGEQVTEHRIQLLTDVIRLLLTMVPDQRGTAIREDTLDYHVHENT